MAQARERSIPAGAESDLHFGPFRLERNTRLWHEERLVALRPQALAVLRYIAERPGQLVTKEEFAQVPVARPLRHPNSAASLCARDSARLTG
jgi:hypothetical protein